MTPYKFKWWDVELSANFHGGKARVMLRQPNHCFAPGDAPYRAVVTYMCPTDAIALGEHLIAWGHAEMEKRRARDRRRRERQKAA